MRPKWAAMSSKYSRIMDTGNTRDTGFCVLETRSVCNIVGRMGKIIICDYVGVF